MSFFDECSASLKMSSLSDRTIKRTISSQSFKRLGVMDQTLKKVMEDILEYDQKESCPDFEITYINVSRRVFFSDIFYSLIQFRFGLLFILIAAVLVIFICIFACVYYYISHDCGLHVDDSMNDAWMFAVLAHFKTCVGPSIPDPQFGKPLPDGTFWNGCTEGIFALFFQLFAGNILMSILLSSLVFNFQSISRRTQTQFNSLTLTKRVYVRQHADSAKFELNVAEVISDTLNVCAHVFLISSTSIVSIANNVPLFVKLPSVLYVDVPREYTQDGPVYSFCTVCGKSAVNMQAHCESFTDSHHLKFAQSLSSNKTVKQIITNLQSNNIALLVILEGTNPVTSDRIQVQKIYQQFSQGDSVGKGPLGITDDGYPEIDYALFL